MIDPLFLQPKLVANYERLVVRCPHERLCLYCCWGWQGPFSAFGYGFLGYYSPVHKTVRTISTHRFSWQLYHRRAIPKGLWCLHLCNNPPCSNPLHLYLGTAKDNAADTVKAGHHISMVAFDRIPRGNNHWMKHPEKRKNYRSPIAKLSDEQVAQMRLDYKNGMRICEISRKYGIGTGHASDIVHWKKRLISFDT